jgi:hypothetical protein
MDENRNPRPHDIADACQQIREGWTRLERRRREELARAKLTALAWLLAQPASRRRAGEHAHRRPRVATMKSAS